MPALEKLEFVLAQRIKGLGKFHIKTANTMHHIATIETQLGNYAKALDYSILVLNVRETMFGMSHLKVANSHTNIASLHDLMGHYEKAFDSF